MTYSVPPVRLNVAEYLKLSIKLLTIVPVALLGGTVKASLFALYHGYSARCYIACAVAKTLFLHLNDREIQVIMPSSIKAFQNWHKAKMKRLSPDLQVVLGLNNGIEPLKDTGGSLMWMGERDKATKVVLHIPGGGFVFPATSGHFEWAWNAYVIGGRNAGVNVAVASLEYTLMTVKSFPSQLRQTVAAVSKLIESGIRPADLIIGGGSAGGNITLQLLGHILHPHPEVPPLILEEPLGGVFLVSPVGSLDIFSNSFVTRHYDMLSPEVFRIVGRYALGEAAIKKTEALYHAGKYVTDIPWKLPLDAHCSWFDGLGDIVDHAYITAGKHEVLLDQCHWLHDTFASKGVRLLRFEVAEREAHDFILLEGVTGRIGDPMRRMRSWFQYAIACQ